MANGSPTVVCKQTKKVINPSRPFYGYGHGSLRDFGPLSPAVIAAIPEKFRRPHPCQTDEKGLDIHLAVPVNNEKGLGLRQFQFSLAPHYAAKFLPRVSIRK